jgi:hypothetical protein
MKAVRGQFLGKNNIFFAQELFDKTRQFLGKISKSFWALLFLPRNYSIFEESSRYETPTMNF